MKKILLLSTAIILSTSISNAYPNMDFSPVGTPFMLMQQQNFRQTQADHLRRFDDDYKEAQETYMDETEQRVEEYKIKKLKQPTKVEIGNKKNELPATTNDENKFYQQNGKIFIKNTDDSKEPSYMLD